MSKTTNYGLKAATHRGELVGN